MHASELLKRVARRTGLTRTRIATARMYCERVVLSHVPRRADARDARILCYHSIGQPAYGAYDVRPARFREHIQLARSQGYRFVPAQQIVATGGEPGDLAITFDDGLRSVLEIAVPILVEFDVPSTCFVVTAWAGHGDEWGRTHALDWTGVVGLHTAGVTIGSHSVTHPDFATLDRDRARHELTASRACLEERLGVTVDAFAIPFGRSSNWGVGMNELAAGAGYSAVYARSDHNRPPGTVSRTCITSVDNRSRFLAALNGAYDGWEG